MVIEANIASKHRLCRHNAMEVRWGCWHAPSSSFSQLRSQQQAA